MQIFSKRVQDYITNQMSICIDDLTNKILNDVPNSSYFFNDLFEYMMQLTIPYTYNYKNLPNNKKLRKYLNEKIYEFFEKNGFTANDKEYLIFDAICHCFINFKEDGILKMYKNRQPEFWYPKVIITKFIGMKEDIDELDNEVLIFRGTSQEEFNSSIFGQSWSLSKAVANKFAFNTYKNIDHHKNTLRVILSTTIKKDSILFYDKNRKEYNGEAEVIIDTKHLSKELVKIEEKQFLKDKVI